MICYAAIDNWNRHLIIHSHSYSLSLSNAYVPGFLHPLSVWCSTYSWVSPNFIARHRVNTLYKTLLPTWENIMPVTVADIYLTPVSGLVASKRTYAITCFCGGGMKRCCWEAFLQVGFQNFGELLTLKMENLSLQYICVCMLLESYSQGKRNAH